MVSFTIFKSLCNYCGEQGLLGQERKWQKARGEPRRQLGRVGWARTAWSQGWREMGRFWD